MKEKTRFTKKKPLMAPHAHHDAKKRKHADNDDHAASKKSRLTVLDSNPVPALSAFSEVSVKLYLHLAPMWIGKTVEGINEQLNAFLMKYVEC
jgi:DNA-directed RNA polymerase I subunit RPA43